MCNNVIVLQCVMMCYLRGLQNEKKVPQKLIINQLCETSWDSIQIISSLLQNNYSIICKSQGYAKKQHGLEKPFSLNVQVYDSVTEHQ